MTFLQAIFQGIVQGLTEFLPVSSSGHLSLIQYFTGQSGDTGLLFSIMLHFGTLIAVFIAFYRTIMDLIVEFFHIIGDLFTGKLLKSKPNPQRRMVYLLILSLVPLLFFVLFSDFYKNLSTDNDIIAEGICFIITSMLLFLADKNSNGRKNAATMKPIDAVAMGIAQGIAPLPGVSRSGSTVAVGLMMGLKKDYAVAFSFIMGVPAVFAANILEVGTAISESADFNIPIILAGIISSIIFGLLAIKMVRWIVTSNKFKYFGYYTLILGVITVVIGIIELMTNHSIQGFLIG
ncbi:MAG: undecaprenyl-diphosphate phosphatase [Oscillospiraceae bacterium]